MGYNITGKFPFVKCFRENPDIFSYLLVLELHKRIEKEIRLSGKKQAEILDKTGLDPKTLRNVRQGKTRPTEATLRLLASALGLAANYFLDSEAQTKPTRTRLALELNLPKGFDLTEQEVDLIARQFNHWGEGILDLLSELRKNRATK